MHRTFLFAMIVAGAAAGCGKKTDDGEGAAKPASEPATPPAPAAPPPPFTGKLTIERVMGLKQAIGSPPPRVLADALARAKGQAGEPTTLDGDTIGWAVVEGDDCAYASITKDGDNLGAVTSPMKVGKGDLPGNRAECLKMAGIEPGPPEDPNAPAPPTDGSAVTADVFRTAGVAARSKWKGQVVKVTGFVDGVSTSTAGGDTWTVIKLKSDATDAGTPVSCKPTKNTSVTVTTGHTVVATGTVQIHEWTSGAGETTLEASLADCTIEAVKGKGQGK